MNRYIYYLMSFVVIASPSSAFAGGAVAQRQQAIDRQRQVAQQQVLQQQQQIFQQRQQSIQRQVAVQQQQAYQQVARQRMAQQQQAYAQALQQRAVAQQQGYAQAVQKKAYQQALTQQAVQQQAYQSAAQQKALAQRQQAAYAAQKQAQLASMRQQQNSAANKRAPARYSSQEAPDEVVSLEKIWKELDSSSEVWAMMMDLEPKVMTVERYMNYFKQQGIHIRKSPPHYVHLIDSMTKDNPNLLRNPFEDLVKLAAIIEYDFDNGLDKERMARQILGEVAYENNRKRLGF